MKRTRITAVVVPLLLAGCTHQVQVEPIRVEPIHVTVDVRVKVDRELESFFDFEEEYEEEEYEPVVDPATQPDAPPAEPYDQPADSPGPSAERSF